VGKSSGLPDHDPNTGTSFPAGGHFLHPTVIEAGQRVAPVLGEDLGKIAARAKGDAQHALSYRLVYHSIPFLQPCYVSL
jgi:hypothetical protein